MVIFFSEQGEMWIGFMASILYYYGLFLIFTAEEKLAVPTLYNIICQHLLQPIMTVNLY